MSNKPHILCRSTAARAAAKFNNGNDHFKVHIRTDEFQKAYRGTENHSLGAFSSEVTTLFRQLCKIAKLKQVTTERHGAIIELTFEATR